MEQSIYPSIYQSLYPSIDGAIYLSILFRFEAEQVACNKQYESDLQSMVDSQKKQVLSLLRLFYQITDMITIKY